MGIQGLTKLLSDQAPGALREQKFENYFGRKIAVDASMHIYSFLVVVGRMGDQLLTTETGEITSHLVGMFFRTTRMLEAGIKPIFVFEGKPPTMKQDELMKRSARREGASSELEAAKEAGDQAGIEKFSKRTIRVTKEHNDDCKKLLTLMGIPVIEAPSEAEAQCAQLCKDGEVYAISTEDMDSLTFGTPLLLRHLMAPAAQKVAVTEFDHTKVLQELELTEDQFIDLCILCGCDYTDKIAGIGPVRALSLIQKHKSIEKVLENLDPDKYKIPESFPYQEARKLFKDPEVLKGRLENFFGPVKIKSGVKRNIQPEKKSVAKKKGKLGGIGKRKSVRSPMEYQVVKKFCPPLPKLLFLLVLVALIQGVTAIENVRESKIEDKDDSRRPFCETYEVKSGDSALSIAQSLGMDYEELLAALKVCISYEEGTFLQAGQNICLPPYSPSCRHVSSTEEDCKLYTVQSGDTLAAIAASFSIDIVELLYPNSLKVTDRVVPGQLLQLPSPGDDCNPPEVVTPQTPAEDVTFGNCTLHSVQSPETIESIADEMKIDKEWIIDANSDLDTDKDGMLKQGVQVSIPLIENGCSENLISPEPCRVFVTNGDQSLEIISSTLNYPIENLLEANPDYLPGAEIEAGAQIRLPPWNPECENGFEIVNKPVLSSPDSTTDLPESGPDVLGSPPVQAPIKSPTPSPSNENIEVPVIDPSTKEHLILDVYLEDLSQTEFDQREREYISFISRLAIVNDTLIRIRFASPTTSLPQNRRLLLIKKEYLRISVIIEGNPSTIFHNLKTNLNTTHFLDELENNDLSIYKISVISSEGQIVILYSSESGELNEEDENTSILPFWGIIGIIAGASVLLLMLISLCICRHCKHRKKAQREVKLIEKRSSRLINSFSSGSLAIADENKHSTKKIVEIKATTGKIPALVETCSQHEHGNLIHIRDIRSDSAFSRQELDSGDNELFPKVPTQHSAVIPTFQSEGTQNSNVLDWLEAQHKTETKADTKLGRNNNFSTEGNIQKGTARYLGKQTSVAGSVEASDNLATTTKPMKGSPRKHLMRYIET
eukprot:jgi/Picsp_1/1715/NSC_05189-R1_rad2 family